VALPDRFTSDAFNLMEVISIAHDRGRTYAGIGRRLSHESMFPMAVNFGPTQRQSRGGPWWKAVITGVSLKAPACPLRERPTSSPQFETTQRRHGDPTGAAVFDEMPAQRLRPLASSTNSLTYASLSALPFGTTHAIDVCAVAVRKHARTG